jgi:5-methylcytosine-specific restriction endonuclease McrA
VIPVKRTALPLQLAANLAAKDAEFKELIDRGAEVPDNVLNAYKAPGIKEHLSSESYGKCVYCESKISHVYWGDVEHIRPKDSFPAGRLDIGNLCLACAKCNNAKSNFWDDVTPLVNPYVDDPADHLLAFGPFLGHRPARDRGRVTVDQLQLNRPELRERRIERWQSLQPLVEQYVQTPDGVVKNVLRKELLNQASDTGEYAMMARAYIKVACDLDV